MILFMKQAAYHPQTAEVQERIEIPAQHEAGGELVFCHAYASMLTARSLRHICSDGRLGHWSELQLVNALHLLKNYRSTLISGLPKTLNGWNQSGLNVTDFLTPGDVVDEDMVDHFRNVLPPLFNRQGFLQSSEPYSSISNCSKTRCRNTYLTFARNERGNWYFAGACFNGEKENREPVMNSVDLALQTLTRSNMESA